MPSLVVDKRSQSISIRAVGPQPSPAPRASSVRCVSTDLFLERTVYNQLGPSRPARASSSCLCHADDKVDV